MPNLSRRCRSWEAAETKTYHAHGSEGTPKEGPNSDTGEPDAVKVARPVRGGGHGKGLAKKLPGVYPGKSKTSTVPRQVPTQPKIGSVVVPASPVPMDKLKAESVAT